MARYLTFQLYGPLSSWGDIAVGEARISSNSPSRSALLGLLSAALGFTRQDEEELQQLSRAVRFAVLVLDPGHLLRDYHTAQVPPASVMKNRPAFTRRDELSVPKNELGTILSARDYRNGARYRVMTEIHQDCPWKLEDLGAALRRPVFPLFLGRKSCPPALPLAPELIEANTVLAAFRAVTAATDISNTHSELDISASAEPPFSLYWEDGMQSGIAPLNSARRRDQPRTRRRWQFDERVEYHALVSELEAESCT